MGKYFILYNDKTNLDVNLLIQNRPSKPSPVMRYEEIEVPGGKSLYKEKGYGDIDIPVSFNFMSKYSWDKDFRIIKQWLLSKVNNKLKFSDDLEVFYKVNKVTIDTPERLMKKIGKFNAIFTCDPYIYYTDGSKEVKLSSLMHNEGVLAKPIYKISGEGLLCLKVNGVTIKANVGQNLIVDTNLGLCYRSDGSINNIALTGAYEDLYLQEGENTFEWTSGFNIDIIPNWRCL